MDVENIKKMEELGLLLANNDEFEIRTLINRRLVIASSFDWALGDDIEITFNEISYMDIPSFINSRNFRFATDEEKNQLYKKKRVFNPKDTDLVFCFEDGIGGYNNFYIVSSEFEFKDNVTTVFDAKKAKMNK